MKKNELIGIAIELLKEEHCECENNTCLIQINIAERYPLNVIEQFASSGAASIKFEKIKKSLWLKYKTPFKMLQREASKICKEVIHQECSSCNAIIWDIDNMYSEEENIRCSNCGTINIWKGSK